MTKQSFKQLRIDEEAEKIESEQSLIRQSKQLISPRQAAQEQSTKQSWD
jgi:hypothetical protein